MATKTDTPNAGAIGTLFAGWQRTGRHANPPICDDIAIEADVVRALYGDPSHRRLAHNTSGLCVADRHGQVPMTSAADAPSSEQPVAAAVRR
jgi:hypothetical protein